MAYLGTEPGVSSQRLKQTFTATAAQTDFPVAGGYYIGQVDVMYNGSFLDETEFTATDGLKVVLAAPATAGHKIVVISYLARGLSDGYLKGEADARFVSTTNGSVGTNNLASASVTTDKIADTNVTTAKLADGSVTTTKIADQNVTLAKLARVGTAGQVLTSGGAGADPAYATLNVVVPVDVQTFNSTGTWTKPTGGQTMARVQIWGGGGGGGASGGYGNGGGGGGYNEWVGSIADIATQTITVGTGGAGTAVNNATAGTGGTSSFTLGGKTVTATGGKGGVSGNISGGNGAGGGPQGTTALAGHWRGGSSGNSNSCGGVSAPEAAVYGGAGGGAAANAGGFSSYGGNGGTNAVGAVPAGGGGGSSAGGAGRAVVTCW